MESTQIYEEYWKLTLAFTDYNGRKFLRALQASVEFIDEYKDEPYSETKYARLQDQLVSLAGISHISVRKAINQLVKLGFVDTHLVSYHLEAKSYLEARTNRKRQSILSKIVYSASSFNRAVNSVSNLRQINFLVNTLVEVGEMSREDITALMLVDIENFAAGYVDRATLDTYVLKAEAENFIKRKYNQVSHLINLLSKLDDIVFVDDKLYFTEDAKNLFGELLETPVTKRDQYLHLIYKNQLKEESAQVFGIPMCMVEAKAFPILIASHIKPFIHSTAEEAYDPNNGILLSQNLDGLFDKGHISFTDSGEIILSKKLDGKLRETLVGYRLHEPFILHKRGLYLKYHRELFRDKLAQ